MPPSTQQSPLSTREFGLRDMNGLRFCFRIGTVDEAVLTADYQQLRFFVPGYDLSETDTILDVGAHIGAFTAYASRTVRHGKVHSIEASAANFHILLENVAINGLSNVKAHRLAIGGRSGMSTLYHGRNNWGHSLSAPKAADRTPDAESVTSQTLEDFLKCNGIHHVDYLKMNVEGAEYDIFLNASKATLQAVALMLIEFHPCGRHSGEEIVGRLDQSGFATSVVLSESEAGKGWITARRL